MHVYGMCMWATATQGKDVSGALPKLLRDLKESLPLPDCQIQMRERAQHFRRQLDAKPPPEAGCARW